MRVAILDDDVEFGEHVVQLMSEAGHDVREFPDAEAMLRALRRESFDLLLLDWILPSSSGMEVLSWVQENLHPAPPAIMMTAKTGDADIVAALTCGADDYIAKPFQDDVFKARINALLRRVYGSKTKQSIECFGQYVVDPTNRTITVSGHDVAVTAKEFALALLLFRNLHRPLSRSYILERVWGQAPNLVSRTLDAHISQIRGRLGLLPENGFRLSSVYSFGYRLEEVEPMITLAERNGARLLNSALSTS